MKSKILMGVFGLGLLLPFTVYAETLSTEEGNNSSEATVTVGDVDVPVYNVEIMWNSFKFDYKYNEEINDFEWIPGKEFITSLLEEYDDFNEDFFNERKNEICLDSTCTTTIDESVTYEEVLTNMDQYYVKEVGSYSNSFDIVDYSIGGAIVPSVKWTSEEEYEYVEGNFAYFDDDYTICEALSEDMFNQIKGSGWVIYSDSTCTTASESLDIYQNGLYYMTYPGQYLLFENEELPEEARNLNSLDEENIYYYYQLRLYLKNKTKPTKKPVSGDTIGKITITIKADE